MVKVLNIVEGDSVLDDDLVQTLHEVALKEAFVKESLAYDSSDEFEVSEVVRIDIRLWIWQISGALRGSLEERVSRVEHLP